MDGNIVWTMTVMDNVTAQLDTMTEAESRLAANTVDVNAKIGAQGAQVEGAAAQTNEYITTTQTATEAGAQNIVTSQEVASTQGEAKVAIDDTTQAVMGQNVEWIKNLAAVSALHMGLVRLTSGMSQLGLISAEDEKKMQKVNAAVGMVVGTYQLFKGITGMMTLFRGVEISLAGVETYLTVLRSKGALLPLVGVGLAAAAVGGAYLYGQSQGGGSSAPTTSVTQNVTFEQGASSDQRAMGRDMLNVMGG
jgi:hypothetical protein